MFNLFFIAFFAIAFGLALAMFITRKKPPGVAGLVPPEVESETDQTPPVSKENLFGLGNKLCETHQLTIREKIEESDRETYWLGESKSDFFFGTYVLAFLATTEDHPYVTLSQILELKDFIKSVRGSKGFAFTNGFFTRDVLQPLEGPQVTLYNKLKVRSELERFSLVG